MDDDRGSNPAERDHAPDRAPDRAQDRGDAHARLRAMLHARLRKQPDPVVSGPRFIVPGATIWAGARAWVARFRELGLARGDRVALDAGPSAAHLMVTVAAWWEGLTLCPVAPGRDDPCSILEGDLDPRAVVTDRPCEARPGMIRAEPAGGPPDCVISSVRTPRTPADRGTDGVAMVLTTSGTTGGPGASPTRVGLSYRNLAHQLSTHARALARPEGAVSVSMLPWHHAFGLLVDLWPALLNGSTVVVEPSGGRDPGSIAQTLRTCGAEHASFVPLQIRGLLDAPGGEAALRALEGGVVGGARAEADLAAALSGTRLRAGYGQTETSPGICLGRPGAWHAGAIGEPVGCEIELRGGELHVRGDNVCDGFWTERGFERRDPGRWHATGDLVERTEEGLGFIGRADDRFKLENGRLIDAPALEGVLRELSPGAVPVLCASGGRSIAAVFLGDRPPPDVGEIRGALGDCGSLLSGAHAWPSAGWLTTKGAPDRGRIAAAIRGEPPMQRAIA